MTTTKSTYHDVVVVDGSNIATEGRSNPSLAQLNDAVMAFRDEFPDATITVVVDATFGHRIDKSEVKQFDEAVAHNEVVAPPAGAIGRGDAFVLSIANKVGARILSNDSFQEFHGEYPWLFDEGRLIGGKPVPYVGWVFVQRLPVKGPTSRKATRATRGPAEARTSRRTASREASQPMPVPTAPPPGPRRGATAGAGRIERATTAAAAPSPPKASAPASAVAGGPVNDLMPFLDFVEQHPVGSSVNGVVESYSSHGAYVQIGDLRGYVPLRLMSDPPPRSARDVMKVGDAVTLVVTSFAAGRRSVDLAVPEAVQAAEIQQVPEADVLVAAVETAPPAVTEGRKRSSTRKASAATAASDEPTAPPAAKKPAAGKKAAAKKTPAKKTATTKSAAKKSAVKKEASTARPRKQAAPPTEEPATSDTTAPAPAPAEEPKARATKASAKKKTTAATAKATTAAATKAPAKKRAPTLKASAAAASGGDEAAVSPAARRRRTKKAAS